MEYIGIISQIVIALGIYNVWLVRSGKPTGYRGGNATNLTEEFAYYGLPPWSVYVIGFLKLLSATFLLIGVVFPSVVDPAALAMLLLMVGAFVMHLKVQDPIHKSIPAISLLVLSILAILF